MKRKIRACRETLDIQKVEHLARQLKISLDSLNYFMTESDRHHYIKEERKPSGKIRTLEPPFEARKSLQRKLNNILKRVALPDFFHGGVSGKTHITNAMPHCGKALVQKFDLKDFFPNITSKMVYKMFVDQLRCHPHVARCLTRLTTYKGHVPQGSPTSSIVALFVLIPAAKRMKNLADQHAWDFTVYVDDLTFSGPLWIVNFRDILTEIATSSGFKVNLEKVIAMRYDHEQEVTGAKVNASKPNITSKKRDALFRQLEILEASDLGLPAMADVQSFIGKVYSIAKLNKGVSKDLLNRPSVKEWRRKYAC